VKKEMMIMYLDASLCLLSGALLCVGAVLMLFRPGRSKVIAFLLGLMVMLGGIFLHRVPEWKMDFTTLLNTFCGLVGCIIAGLICVVIDIRLKNRRSQLPG